MTEILETIMLICFGISWPVSLVKSIRSKTAKSTSLQFLLLIIVGYVAGIAAKIISGRINYVLIVYLLNLAAVLVNLVVYFHNRKRDERKEKMRQGELCVLGDNHSEISAARQRLKGEKKQNKMQTAQRCSL